MRIIIGNCLSIVAAVFMSLAAMVSGRRRVFIFQTFDCIFLGTAQLVFGIPSGAISLFVGAARNITAVFTRYNLCTMLLFSCAILILGIASNTAGLLGLVPVLASLILTVGIFFARSRLALKLVLLVNLSLWSSYSFFVYDITTGITNLVSAIICLASLVVLLLKQTGKKLIKRA